MAATQNALRSITYLADSTLGIYTGVPGQPGSLSPNGAKQFCFVALTTTADRTVTLGTKALATAGKVIGVLQNKPQTTNDAATVGFSGETRAIAGAAIASGGLPLTLDTAGRVVPGTPGTDPIVGISVSSAANANDLLSVLLP